MKREKKLAGLHNEIVEAINKSNMPEQEVLLVIELVKKHILESFERKLG